MNWEWLDSEDFYKICQYYRHMPMTKPREVKEAFDDLKSFIRQQVEAQDAVREG